MHLAAGSDRVGMLAVRTLSGRRLRVFPGCVVLACGGIENARLLLASRSDRDCGLGNEFDRVGRHFMEHLHVPAGHLIAAEGPWSRSYFNKAIFEDVRLRGVITPTAAARQRHRLLSTSIAIEGASFSFGTPFVGWPPPVTFGPVRRYRTLRTGRLRPAVEKLKQLAERTQAVPQKIRTGRAARAALRRAGRLDPGERVYSLYFRSEQAPDPVNRVRLSSATDALGMPTTRLDWRVQPIDSEGVRGWLGILDSDLRQLRVGRVIPPADRWQSGIIGGPHHMGTTRMSADPRLGVVDGSCRVHSVANLYVAGSSVFATSGYANPTFALVTLALRPADTLRTRLSRTVHL